MSRDPAKLKKPDLLEELATKHGITEVEVERELTDVDPSKVEHRPAKDFTVAELVERFAGLLDTTTEKEREEYARVATEKENRQAEKQPFQF